MAGIDDDLPVACYWRSDVSGALEPYSSDEYTGCDSQSPAISTAAHTYCHTDQAVTTYIGSRDLRFYEVVSVTTASCFRRSDSILRRSPNPCDSYPWVISASQVFAHAWFHASHHRLIWVAEDL